jgi:geranylgeranyl diphosphate synthase type II
MVEETKQEVAEPANLWNYVERQKPNIETALRQFSPLAPPNIETEFNAALEYALFQGGKRLRPVLTLLSAEIVGGKAETVLPSAIAVEFIHSSSLIFDDLPCMNNARERRVKASLHEKYGEGLAILVALGLLNVSYGLVFVNHQTLPERAMQAHAEIVECVGASGMVGGQSLDLAVAKGASSNDTFEKESVGNLKTSALMRLALRIGAILAGADYSQLNLLSRFAELLGDAYQLSDDLLDFEEDSEVFEMRKAFASSYGENAARLRLKSLINEAKRILMENFPPSEARTNLLQLTDYLSERKA